MGSRLLFINIYCYQFATTKSQTNIHKQTYTPLKYRGVSTENSAYGKH